MFTKHLPRNEDTFRDGSFVCISRVSSFVFVILFHRDSGDWVSTIFAGNAANFVQTFPVLAAALNSRISLDTSLPSSLVLLTEPVCNSRVHVPANVPIDINLRFPWTSVTF